ncbi:thiamine phosphate synthase [Flavobacterium sp. Sd200]|uniref:thiamine phosphate synthase n=1 Tax=Flavobacterium sp. Sd200 TaxID=2692211 RepID=UPI00136B1FD9|nr:thiamine phosphate synthase [Flavobacterium sp. Sd200]MXN91058.1 thiamine phosphate synthase [Flavobacterium sp. Sd200]
MINDFPYRLYLVAGEADCMGRDILWVAEEAVKGGVQLVQLREKHKTTAAFAQTAFRLKEMLDKYNVPLIINDNVDVAVNCGAAGVHVGNSDMPPSGVIQQWPQCGMLGYSIEYLEQLNSIEMHYATHLGISPIFNTPTKNDTVTEWGLEGLKKIRILTNKPLVAIGSMNAANAHNVIKAGADCIAVVSAICAAQHPAKAAEKIRNNIENAL